MQTTLSFDIASELSSLFTASFLHMNWLIDEYPLFDRGGAGTTWSNCSHDSVASRCTARNNGLGFCRIIITLAGTRKSICGSVWRWRNRAARQSFCRLLVPCFYADVREIAGPVQSIFVICVASLGYIVTKIKNDDALIFYMTKVIFSLFEVSHCLVIILVVMKETNWQTR